MTEPPEPIDVPKRSSAKDEAVDCWKITDFTKLLTLIEQRQKSKRLEFSKHEMVVALKKTVFGQDQIINDLCDFIQFRWSKKHEPRSRPIASLLLLGPHGTGKTQLSRALAEYLFEDEKWMLTFDCHNLKGAHALTTLIGSSGVYQGAEAGQLTGPMFRKRDRLIRFDEPHEADRSIFDIFLSVMREGRLRDQNSNKDANFSESILVFECNALSDQAVELAEQIECPDELSKAVSLMLRNEQIFPESFLKDLDKIYVFNPLSFRAKVAIAESQLFKLANHYGIELVSIDDTIIPAIVAECECSNEARVVQRVVDRRFEPPIVNAIANSWKRIRIEIGPDDLPIARHA